MLESIMNYSKETIDNLTALYGSPLYVFDEAGFIDNFKALERAMKSYYSNYRIAYSFKTNYAPYICRIVHDLGGYAEVVSPLEYNLAKKIGFTDENIIFNGPLKSSAGIKALQCGSIVNADNLEELEMLCEAAKKVNKKLPIGIRVNINAGQDFISRFGLDEKDIELAFKIADKSSVRISGLHCHISRARGLNAWAERTQKMLKLADKYLPEGPDYIDLGSGMFGDMDPEFASQFKDVPTYDQYARVTAKTISEHYQTKKPLFFTEPGTTLISRYIDVISRVESIKSIDNHMFAVLDSSVHNLGETCILKKLPVSVVSGGNKQLSYEAIDLTGYTCLEQDILYAGYNGLLARGDYVVFGNAGGYSNVLKPPFIRPNCAMIAKKSNGEYSLIKAAETEDDLLNTYY